jgi:hypothetical protein
MGSCALSAPFTVEAVQLKRLARPVPALLNTIQILSPLAGQVYTIGSTMTIRWKTDRIASFPTVWLQVCWPDGTPAAGAYPAPNTGSYDWPIHETAENSLRVSVFTPGEKYKGMSGTFQVKFPPH